MKAIFYKRTQRVSEILFSTRENNVHMFKLTCNVLFIIWSEVGTSEQRTYKSHGKIHAFFNPRYIFFHIFASESMENTSVLVYGKTPITMHIINRDQHLKRYKQNSTFQAKKAFETSNSVYLSLWAV